MRARRWRVVAGVSTALAGLGIAAAVTLPSNAAELPSAAPAAAAASVLSQRTSATERRRVDAVPTPKLDWYKCFKIAECATVRLPLDYDRPKGAKIELGVVRVKAKNQKKKIGSLFLNPGGPGAPASEITLDAPSFLSDSVLERFDVVGLDPRGIGASQNVKCFRTHKAQTAVMDKLDVAFPITKAEEKPYISGSKQFGQACSTTGKPVAVSMSTAEVARDHEVLRRAVGDKKLNFLGFSYGSALGQYYANMFPDRFRTIAVDGVLDPRGWVGNKRQILEDRLNSSAGADKALKEILKRCDKAGATRCEFAAGDPVKNFDALLRRLKAKPLLVEAPDGGEVIYTQADFVYDIYNELYDAEAGAKVTELAVAVSDAFTGDTTAVRERSRAARANRPGRDFAYDNFAEAYSAILCTDGLFPAKVESWPAAADARAKKTPNFGRLLAWGDSQCASKTWTGKDEDAYVGPFGKRTAAPVLVVGNYWDPATNYDDAVKSSKLLPNSRLLSSNNWGHTAYGRSDCATRTIDSYLLTGKVPAKNVVCSDAPQPFTVPLDEELRTQDQRTDKKLPPVVAPRPNVALTQAR